MVSITKDNTYFFVVFGVAIINKHITIFKLEKLLHGKSCL